MADQKRSFELHKEGMKSGNLQGMDNNIKLKLPSAIENEVDVDQGKFDVNTDKLREKLKKLTEKIQRKNEKIKNLGKNIKKVHTGTTEEKSKIKRAKTAKFSGDTAKAILHSLLQKYKIAIDGMKSHFSVGDLENIKHTIQNYFALILKEAEEDPNPYINAEAKQAEFDELVSTFNLILKTLEQAAKKAVKGEEGLNEARLILSEPLTDPGIKSPEEPDETAPMFTKLVPDEEFEDITTDIDDATNGDVEVYSPDPMGVKEKNTKSSVNTNKPTSLLDEEELRIRIRRIDRGSVDGNGKLQAMDLMQRKKLEQAFKDKLEKSGLETGGRRIEVKIITAGYFENGERNDFPTITDEETHQFQNMVITYLAGQQEAFQEMERHKNLEESYEYNWGIDENEIEDF